MAKLKGEETESAPEVTPIAGFVQILRDNLMTISGSKTANADEVTRVREGYQQIADQLSQEAKEAVEAFLASAEDALRTRGSFIVADPQVTNLIRTLEAPDAIMPALKEESEEADESARIEALKQATPEQIMRAMIPNEAERKTLSDAGISLTTPEIVSMDRDGETKQMVRVAFSFDTSKYDFDIPENELYIEDMATL